ncbi:MAG: hypothetical protein E7633_03240 [Ruminococcaceae bacterium]|nr:hypothetical protein [Oscillospiraceae bacterium]
MNNDIFDFSEKSFLNVADIIPRDGSRDVADDIQNIIDANPNRTIYFPDGTYILSKPICTPADPKKSVSLQLSKYAIIKASDDWNSEEALVRLGGKDAFNDIYTDGSNYSFVGGIVDGNERANGISIDSGRETLIRDVSIKHTVIGIHIKRGANSGSSDADIMNVNIVGRGDTSSKGVLIEGWDNTFTNMRIAKVFTGVEIRSAGNFLRNIHPLYVSNYEDYENSCAFRDVEGGNFYNNCYSDQFGIGFYTAESRLSTFDSCFCFWYSPKMGRHTAFKAEKKFCSVVANFKSGFRNDTENILLSVGESGGNGILSNPIVNPNILADDTYKEYLRGEVIG